MRMRCRSAVGGLALLIGYTLASVTWAADDPASIPPSPKDLRAPGANATLAEIEACASRNLPDAGGVIAFRVDAVDRTGVVTSSRAEMRWRRDDEERAQFLLRVSEPARIAGTTLLVVDRAADRPEFYVRLPEVERVKRVHSRRLRGPVLGTDFSYEDLKHLREPLEKTGVELVGTAELDGRPAWLLEAIPREEDDSEYSRVLTWVEQEHCLPLRVDLFEGKTGCANGSRHPGAGSVGSAPRCCPTSSSCRTCGGRHGRSCGWRTSRSGPICRPSISRSVPCRIHRPLPLLAE